MLISILAKFDEQEHYPYFATLITYQFIYKASVHCTVRSIGRIGTSIQVEERMRRFGSWI